MKDVEVLKEKNKHSEYFIMMIDEVYLQEDRSNKVENMLDSCRWTIYKGIVGLKHFVSFVIKALVKVLINGQYLANKMKENIKQ